MTPIVELDRTGRRRTMIRAILGFCVVATAFLPIAALAHVVVGDGHGFLRGFSHPLGGIDHVLAMIAVGLFAARLGGRALWLVPLSFVSVMALAGIAGMAGVELPLVQVGIGLSVVALGVVVALQLGVRTSVAASLVGLFAIFHGHAPGVEIPETMSALAYGAGLSAPPRCCMRQALALVSRSTRPATSMVVASLKLVGLRLRSRV